MSKKMIALISHSAGLQGAEKMLLNLAILLKKEGQFIPLLMVPNTLGTLFEGAKKHGIRCVSYEPAPWHIFSINFQTFSRQYQSSYTSLRAALVENPCDLVVVNTHVSMVPVNVAVELKIPLVVWLHGIIDSSMIEPTPGFSHLCTQWMLNAASKTIVVSKWTGDFYRSFYDMPDYCLVYNWYTEEKENDSTGDRYQSRIFICLGAHEDIKGIDVLIDAAVELKRRGCEFEIDLYGAGPLHQQYQNDVKANSLSDRVRFHGFVSGGGNLLEDKLCVISTSYVDSFGLTLVEGMAHKMPVIATRSGGPNEIVEDGNTGFLIERGDYMALADKMETLLQSPQLAKEMGENGYLVFQERFSEMAASQSIHAILTEAISNYEPLDKIYGLAAKFFQSLLDPDLFRPISSSLVAPADMIEHEDSHPVVIWHSSLRLEAGLQYKFTPEKNILFGLKVPVVADKVSLPVNIIMKLRLPNGLILRTANKQISVFGQETWLVFEFLPITNIRGRQLLLELVPADPSINVIRVCEKNAFEGKLKRIYRRVVGILGFMTRGNQLYFIEL